MKIIEHLQTAKNPTISVEIIPPRRGRNIRKIHDAIESIRHYHPAFIDVTSHAAEVVWEETVNGTFKKKVKRKSPGTFGLCAAIKYKFNIEPVPHVLCGGFTREETEDALIELNYLGIENVLAIRGDKQYYREIPDDRSLNNFALDLVKQISDMNKGQYVDDLIDAAQSDFCIGVACYPEKHFQSPNMRFDLNILQQKVDAGAHYAVTQMFFDNTAFFEYVEKARAAGIQIPILPGLKILTSKSQLSRIPEIFYIDIPFELSDRMMAAKTREEEIQVGIDWTCKQALDLLEKGFPHLHFYIMQNTKPFLDMMDRLEKKL
jgi:methylenetetrahydrofolate reductase (NADPH)